MTQASFAHSLVKESFESNLSFQYLPVACLSEWAFGGLAWETRIHVDQTSTELELIGPHSYLPYMHIDFREYMARQSRYLHRTDVCLPL